MIIYKCDKCKKVIRKPKMVKIEGHQDDAVIKVLQKMELCEKCYTGIYTLIDDFVSHNA